MERMGALIEFYVTFLIISPINNICQFFFLFNDARLANGKCIVLISHKPVIYNYKAFNVRCNHFNYILLKCTTIIISTGSLYSFDSSLSTPLVISG